MDFEIQAKILGGLKDFASLFNGESTLLAEDIDKTQQVLSRATRGSISLRSLLDIFPSFFLNIPPAPYARPGRCAPSQSGEFSQLL